MSYTNKQACTMNNNNKKQESLLKLHLGDLIITQYDRQTDRQTSCHLLLSTVPTDYQYCFSWS